MSNTPEYIVFTDASLRRNSNRSYCAFGVVVLNMKTLKYASFGAELGSRTVTFGEGWAIYRGIQAVCSIIDKDRKDPAEVLVVTDSKLTVKVLSEYIPFVWDTSNWNNWKKVDGSPVKNQGLYRKIVAYINDHPEIHPRITHINSHKSIDTDWNSIQSKLKKYGIRTDPATTKVFMQMNDLADSICQSITKKMKDEEEKSGEFMRLIPKGELS